jgi:hypothetical protein
VVAHPGGESHPRAARRLNEPRLAIVDAVESLPVSVDRIRIEIVREEWRVHERWWTGDPVRRRYFDVVLESGENVVVFEDEKDGRWYQQRA